MFGVDQWIASLSDGATLLVVAAVAVALGLRHAGDPDHVAAVGTLVASTRDRAARRAGALGAAWGAGHAGSLFALGLPIVLYRAYLPEPVQSGAETAVGVMIVALGVWLLVRWRRGLFGDETGAGPSHARARTLWQACTIGVVHGVGGSAGVGILLLSSIPNHALAVAALGLFAACTALSMAVLSTGVGLTMGSALSRRAFRQVVPVVGLASLLFGVWYALGAQSLVPYYF